ALQSLRGWARPLSRAEREELVEAYIDQLGIAPSDPDILVEQLSGGNQQKVLLARWLATRPHLGILDAPPTGIGRRRRRARQARRPRRAVSHVGVVIIASARGELVRLGDRIVVMEDRVKIGEVSNGPGLTVEAIVAMIAAPDEADDVPPPDGTTPC